jgi:hypothetical protein
VTRGFTVCSVRRILFYDQIKDEEVGGACGVYGRGRKRIRGFGVVRPGVRDFF